MFFKRLVYWVGMVSILLTVIFAAQRFFTAYPELEPGQMMVASQVNDIIANGSWSSGVLLACALCAFGSYLVMALELWRLRRKVAAHAAEAKK